MPHPDQILGVFLPQEQIDYWLLPEGTPHQIGRWPTNGSPRSDIRYRMLPQTLQNPLATRYLVHLTAVDTFPPFPQPDLDVWAWIDLVDGAGNDYQGSTAVAPVTPRCDLRLTEEATLPTSNLPGIQLIATWTNETGSFSTTFEWQNATPTSFTNPIQTVTHPATARTESAPGFGFNDRNCEVYGVSECYLFPIDPDLLIGQAAFNGIDAYIDLTNLLAGFNAPFMLEAEIRLKNVTTFWPILGRNNAGGFFGMDNANIVFGNLTLPTTWTPFLDQWFTWKYEFEPVGLLQHKLTIDGIVVRDSTNARQFPMFDHLGVFRRTQPQVIWGDFDMRMIKYQAGTPGNYTTVLDMPLLVNALDRGPLLNHGTTFNMPLPSS